MKMTSILLMVIALSFTACSKDGGGGSSGMAPSNLVVTAVVNPDNSGNVSFTATATNAVTYDFNYGNGSFQTVPSGIITYKYAASGAYTVTVTATSSGGQSVSKTVQVTVNIVRALVWSDEFDVAGAPDASKWGYDIGTGSNGWGNNELQYYTSRADNVKVEGGVLKIIAKKENYLGSLFTSARLLTKDKYSFKYGRLEVKAKLTMGGGTWPAIWMLGSNFLTAGWPQCGEIDVMEYKGNEPNKIYATLHYPGNSGGGGVSNNLTITNAATDFHVYSTEWTSSSIKFFVDDQLFHTFSNSAALPFNQNFFMILNLAMGGNFGGAVDPAVTGATMEVDYVRVYQ